MASDDRSYLTVPNWKKHQHRDLADKGDMPWFKLDSGIFDDPAIAELSAAEFRAYVRALTLAARTGNKLPASANWLRAHFGRSWVQLCTTLVRNSLLSGTLPPRKAPQNGKTHRATDAPLPSLEERRVEKEQEQGSPTNVPLDVVGEPDKPALQAPARGLELNGHTTTVDAILAGIRAQQAQDDNNPF